MAEAWSDEATHTVIRTQYTLSITLNQAWTIKRRDRAERSTTVSNRILMRSYSIHDVEFLQCIFTFPSYAMKNRQ